MLIPIAYLLPLQCNVSFLPFSAPTLVYICHKEDTNFFVVSFNVLKPLSFVENWLVIVSNPLKFRTVIDPIRISTLNDCLDSLICTRYLALAESEAKLIKFPRLLTVSTRCICLFADEHGVHKIRCNM